MKLPVPCPKNSFCPAGSSRPQHCGALLNVNDSQTGCRLSGAAVGIIASCVMGAFAAGFFVLLRLHKRYRARLGERAALLHQKEPTYEGL